MCPLRQKKENASDKKSLFRYDQSKKKESGSDRLKPGTLVGTLTKSRTNSAIILLPPFLSKYVLQRW